MLYVCGDTFAAGLLRQRVSFAAFTVLSISHEEKYFHSNSERNQCQWQKFNKNAGIGKNI